MGSQGVGHDWATDLIWSLVFSKSSLNIWKFKVHVLLKPGLENFEHYFTRMWDECNCVVVWAFFGIAFLWDWNEYWPFQSRGHCWVLQICWHIECSTFTASSFRIWNSSTGIPSPPLALFIVMFSKAHLSGGFIWYMRGRTKQMGETDDHKCFRGSCIRNSHLLVTIWVTI